MVGSGPLLLFPARRLLLLFPATPLLLLLCFLPNLLFVEQIPFFALEAGKLASYANLDLDPFIFITNALAAFGDLRGG